MIVHNIFAFFLAVCIKAAHHFCCWCCYDRLTSLPPLWLVCGVVWLRRPPWILPTALKNSVAKMTCTFCSTRSAEMILSTWKAKNNVANTSWTNPARFSLELITDPRAVVGSTDNLPMWLYQQLNFFWKCPDWAHPNVAIPSKWPVPFLAS